MSQATIHGAVMQALTDAPANQARQITFRTKLLNSGTPVLNLTALPGTPVSILLSADFVGTLNADAISGAAIAAFNLPVARTNDSLVVYLTRSAGTATIFIHEA